MSVTDIIYLLQWWGMFFLIGGAFFPFVTKFFPHFVDKGYIFSKTLGIAAISYLIFLLGLSHILPFNKITGVVILLIIVSIYVFLALILPSVRKREYNGLRETIRNNWYILLLEEVLFLLAIAFWSYIRSFSPDIHGLEKFMDFGFINSILRAEYFPPKDMWLPPFAINYYYFGHLVTAVLTKISGIPSSISYNLMLATIFAFCFTASFSIATTLSSLVFSKTHVSQRIRLLASGLLTAGLVALAGNLHVIYTLFKPYENENPVPPWQLVFSPFAFPNNYWYPNATRFIHNTIHEFPIYSWIVADLHGHVLDIPFVLLTIAVLLSLFLKLTKQDVILKPEGLKDLRHHRKINWILRFAQNDIIGNLKFDIGYLILIGFLLAVMYMTNAWDGFIYFLLTGLVLFSATLLHRNTTTLFSGLLRTAITITPAMLVVGITFAFFSLPFSVNFKPFVSGIGILCGSDILGPILGGATNVGLFLFEENHCQHSPWWQLLILYGFFYFFIAAFMVYILKLTKLNRSDLFVLILIVLGTFLIVIPEFIYVKDIYPAHYRANTMFKLVFQSFIMLSIASGYIFVRTVSSIRYKVLSIKGKILATCYLLLATSLFVLVFTYPRLATYSYYGNLKTPSGLDGMTYLKTLYPEDYAAINWINQNISGQPVMLEAQGDSYTDHGRISANTGLPTVLGWTVHEWLWRGKYDGGVDAPAPRIGEIQKMYESDNLSETKKLLDKYGVEYVYIGGLERQKYPNINEEKFNQLGKVIYKINNTKIYQLFY